MNQLRVKIVAVESEPINGGIRMGAIDYHPIHASIGELSSISGDAIAEYFNMVVTKLVTEKMAGEPPELHTRAHKPLFFQINPERNQASFVLATYARPINDDMELIDGPAEHLGYVSGCIFNLTE